VAALRPGASLHVHYRASTPPFILDTNHVDVLRAGVGTFVVEQILRHLVEGQQPPTPEWESRLLGYAHFSLVYRDRGDGSDITLVPDPAGRKLAAVFTADDAVSLCTDQWSAPEPAHAARASGMRLFALLRRLGVDGCVFNPCGPGAPLAVSSELVDRLCAVAASSAPVDEGVPV